jgi:membrane associated rhomboid family serine protease
MIIPFKAEHDEPRRPVANVLIVLVTSLTSIAMFLDLLLLALGGEGRPTAHLALTRRAPELSQLVGHTLLHAGPWHLIGNMVVLLAVGNAVNARLGHLRYLALYLLSAIAGGAGWLAFGDGELAVGASGAVCGVLAAFLLLFPITRVRVLFWALGLVLALVIVAWALADPLVAAIAGSLAVTWWGVGALGALFGETPPEGALLRILGFRTFPLAGLWVALMYLVSDLAAVATSARDGVAHEAHLGGALAGASVALALLTTGAVRGTLHGPTLFDLLRRAPRYDAGPSAGSGSIPMQ